MWSGPAWLTLEPPGTPFSSRFSDANLGELMSNLGELMSNSEKHDVDL